MPLSKLVLILVCVLAAAALTVWLGAVVLASAVTPWSLAAILPVSLLLYVLVRVILDRVRSEDDDRYDRVPR